jgi:hypothetical protein
MSDGAIPLKEAKRKVGRDKDDQDRETYSAAPIQVDEPASNITATPFVWRPAIEIPRRQWIYAHHLTRGFGTGTVAPGGTGKSALGITDALAIVTGRNLLGKNEDDQPRSVWLYNLEDPLEEIERRLAAACLHFGIGAEDIDGRLFVNSGRDTPLVIASKDRDATVIHRPDVDAIVAEIRENAIDVLVIDPFVSSHALPENDNSAIDAAVKEWHRVAYRAGCAVELVHHVRKSNGVGETTAEDARGGKAFVDGLRSVRVLNRMTKDEAEKAGVEDGHWRYFRAELGKSNMAPPPEKADWHRLESVDLGQGDNVGVVTRWTWPDAFQDVTAHDLLAVQKRIGEGAWKKDPQADDWAGIAVGSVLDLDPARKSDKERIKKLIDTWVKNDALREERRKDPKQRREKPFIVVGRWAEP